jgi:hypothetical protein
MGCRAYDFCTHQLKAKKIKREIFALLKRDTLVGKKFFKIFRERHGLSFFIK